MLISYLYLIQKNILLIPLQNGFQELLCCELFNNYTDGPYIDFFLIEAKGYLKQ